MAASSTSTTGCATGSTIYDASEEKTNGTRLARLLIDVGTHVLRKFLHSIYPPETLENVLKKNRARLQEKVRFDDQWENLFPPSGDPPDSTKFDITLLHLLIREVCYLPEPLNGWHKMPAEDDESLQANITRIKCFRNELCHSVSTGIPNGEFEDKWNKISSALEAIEIHVCRHQIQGLKNDSIDHGTRRAVEDQVEQWRKQQEEVEPITELCNCLPDKIPDESMFGRSQEVQRVKQHVQNGTVSVVVITGGPGFGKTTVAKAVAHELVKPENGKTVLFCSLLSKNSFSEVATEMIHSCGKIYTQVPENPDQWLKDWSKQVQTQVTFVLDNADGVLESEDRNSFLTTLGAIRKLSKQDVTFVITSRKTLQDPDLPSKDVRLDPLSPEEAKKILLSRVNDEGTRKKLSKTESLVELCGCVPLALCIVGSLLSDYTEEMLVKHLEERPMTLLKDVDKSVQTAIKTSFDLLNKAEQDALILMSVFPGSFDCNAAEAVMGACSDHGTLPGSILRSLKNRSLVEQPRSRRYQFHPLIRAFAKEIVQTKSEPLLLDGGEKLACAHFKARLDGNANIFWSKDTCKESIESFSEDRHNFEHFLAVFSQRIENQDQEIAEGCKTFLEDFTQKCMYLEKCVQPKFYIQFLEQLLRSFKPEIHPVHRVELLCLLGHEMRKVGKKEKYDTYMVEANQLYSKKTDAFTTRVLSNVFYLHSYARYLSEYNIPDKPKEFYNNAIEICKEKIPGHPETAATLLIAGRYAKRRKENDEAEEMFKQALDLFTKLLGDHFMTALCLKDIADFLFFVDKTDSHLNKPLSFYRKAMEMMEKLGVGNQKESILTLKNYGVCHMKNGNFEEAISLLQRAESVAERELEKDHMWKAMVKTELAIVHYKVAYAREMEPPLKQRVLNKMEASLKDGLDMSYRLVGSRTIDHLGNKHLIRKVLNYYPEKFPEEQYPRR